MHDELIIRQASNNLYSALTLYLHEATEENQTRFLRLVKHYSLFDISTRLTRDGGIILTWRKHTNG